MQDPASCSASINAFVNDATPVQVSIDSLQNPLCYDGNDGTIHITASGGTTPYSYSWSNGSLVEDQTALGFGTYTVVVSDFSGCQASNSATLYNPPELSAYISSTEDVL